MLQGKFNAQMPVGVNSENITLFDRKIIAVFCACWNAANYPAGFKAVVNSAASFEQAVSGLNSRFGNRNKFRRVGLFCY